MLIMKDLLSTARRDSGDVIMKAPGRRLSAALRSTRSGMLLFTPGTYSKNAVLQVFSASGRMVASKRVDDGPASIDLRNRSAGVVFVKVGRLGEARQAMLPCVKAK
jgi:hypothetical protein